MPTQDFERGAKIEDNNNNDHNLLTFGNIINFVIKNNVNVMSTYYFNFIEIPLEGTVIRHQLMIIFTIHKEIILLHFQQNQVCKFMH